MAVLPDWQEGRIASCCRNCAKTVVHDRHSKIGPGSCLSYRLKLEEQGEIESQRCCSSWANSILESQPYFDYDCVHARVCDSGSHFSFADYSCPDEKYPGRTQGQSQRTMVRERRIRGSASQPEPSRRHAWPRAEPESVSYYGLIVSPCADE